jgi:uncharacterized membrane protein YoaK (UPF0700 family)
LASRGPFPPVRRDDRGRKVVDEVSQGGTSEPGSTPSPSPNPAPEPAPAPRTPVPLVATLGALTVVSGFLDAVSYLGLGHVFTANMTGNVALLGFAAAGAAGFSMTASLCALGCFLVGAVFAGRLARHVGPLRSLLVTVMVLEATLTATAAVIAAAAGAIGHPGPRYTVIALLAFTMGARNVVVRRLGVPDMTTTVLTTTLTGLAADSTPAGGSNTNARNRTTSVACMFGGALVGAVLVLHVGAPWSLGVASAIVVATTVFCARLVPVAFETSAS